jgi:hypothetical protein
MIIVKALHRPGLVVSKKSDAFHGAVKDSVDTAGIYVEELENSSSSGSEGDNEQKSAVWGDVLQHIDHPLKLQMSQRPQSRAYWNPIA